MGRSQCTSLSIQIAGNEMDMLGPCVCVCVFVPMLTMCFCLVPNFYSYRLCNELALHLTTAIWLTVQFECDRKVNSKLREDYGEKIVNS